MDLGSITDVTGMRVGSAERVGDGWLSGCTVVLPPPGTVGAVDVRGGAPATHETDALGATSLVPTVDAVLLTGGSAYGLAAAAGVQRWCEEHGRGFPVGDGVVVPVVPALGLFDLGRGGDPSARPEAALGYAAAEAAAGGAETGAVRRGSVGAGTGALAARRLLRGGLGTASVRVPVAAGEVVVGAAAAVNAAGSPLDPWTGGLLADHVLPPHQRPPLPAPDELARWQELLAVPPAQPSFGSNTTLVVVATDAAFDVPATSRVAVAAHDGLARALSPAHTMVDGDAVVALSTGAVALAGLLETVAVQAAAADAVARAVVDAVLSATSAAVAPSLAELMPSAYA